MWRRAMAAVSVRARSVRWVLAVTMGVVFTASAVGAGILWPKGDDTVAPRDLLAAGTNFEFGVVTEVTPPDTLADGPSARAEILVRLDATQEAQPIQPVPEVGAEDIHPGDRVKVLFIPEAAATGSPYVFVDFERGAPLALLAAIFAVAVVAVARWRGVAALAGLGAALALVWFFSLPALAAGRDGVAVALVTAGLVLFIVVYATHGISVRTTTALLGTYLGTGIVLGLAAWMIPATHLTPRTHENMGELLAYAPAVNLRGVLLCGMVLAGIGVLNDVTITQASAVWELRGADPAMPRRTLFTRAMRIGRDHIASTVYTIAFAYVGTALATLLLARTFDHSFAALVTFEEIADEIVRTLVASVGLVVAIPLTTGIGVALAGGRPEVRAGSPEAG